jgi:hypothetical protein
MNSKEQDRQPVREKGSTEVNFNHLSSQFLSGIYRGIPKLTVDPSEETWDRISQELNTFASDKAKGNFEVILLTSDRETHVFADETRVVGLPAGKRALIQQQAGGEIVAESVIDLDSGHFAARSASGIISRVEAEGPAITPLEGNSHADVAAEARTFAEDFVLSTPEYRCPGIDYQVSRQTGAVAAASRVQVAY